MINCSLLANCSKIIKKEKRSQQYYIMRKVELKILVLQCLVLCVLVVLNLSTSETFLAQNSSMLYETLARVSSYNRKYSSSESQNVTILLLHNQSYSLGQDTSFIFPRKVNLTLKSASTSTNAVRSDTALATIQLIASKSNPPSFGFVLFKNESFLHLDNIRISNSTGGFFDQVSNALITNCIIDDYSVSSPTEFFLNFQINF